MAQTYDVHVYRDVNPVQVVVSPRGGNGAAFQVRPGEGVTAGENAERLITAMVQAYNDAVEDADAGGGDPIVCARCEGDPDAPHAEPHPEDDELARAEADIIQPADVHGTF